MKTSIRLIMLLAALLAAQVCAAQAPAGAPAGTTAVCNDGTYSSAASKRGACSGHKGVKDWYGAAAAAPAKTSAATAPAATPATPSPRAKTNAAAPAAGGGAGQVWLNTASNVYHCQGDRYYGKTKAGSYMTEAEAKAKGGRPDHGKACQ